MNLTKICITLVDCSWYHKKSVISYVHWMTGENYAESKSKEKREFLLRAKYRPGMTGYNYDWMIVLPDANDSPCDYWADQSVCKIHGMGVDFVKKILIGGTKILFWLIYKQWVLHNHHSWRRCQQVWSFIMNSDTFSGWLSFNYLYKVPLTTVLNW